MNKLVKWFRRKPKIAKITSIGQQFEYDDKIVVLTQVVWSVRHGYELRLNSIEEYSND